MTVFLLRFAVIFIDFSFTIILSFKLELLEYGYSTLKLPIERFVAVENLIIIVYL
ncbi:hypothetical protein JAMGFMIE_01823 [Rheinheimera sp. MM224]|nr:hypothetical protein JAMGFMIE_01823 [Rheinheimera sp. MM224]